MSRSARPALLAATLLFAAGLGACSGDEQESRSVTEQTANNPLPASAKDRGDCQTAGEAGAERLHLCFKPNADDHGRFFLESGSSERQLAVSPPGPTPSAGAAGLVGHWAWAALSPNGKTILAQWSAECEVPIAFLVDIRVGNPRPITGEKDWAKAPVSVALGWTTDGRAIAFLPKGPACGNAANVSGLYLYPSPGEGELLLRAKKTPLEASTAARPVSAVRRAAS
jgi:hypothetical protein